MMLNRRSVFVGPNKHKTFGHMLHLFWTKKFVAKCIHAVVYFWRVTKLGVFRQTDSEQMGRALRHFLLSVGNVNTFRPRMYKSIIVQQSKSQYRLLDILIIRYKKITPQDNFRYFKYGFLWKDCIYCMMYIFCNKKHIY